MHKSTGFVILVMLVGGFHISTALAQQEHRQLGPHQHGHGQFNMVMEGRKAIMELHIPGHDITGFEHKPSTPAQVAAVNKAVAQLKSGLSLFVPPAAAQCKLISANVETASEEHDDHHDKDGDDHDGGHMEFRVRYELECNVPKKLDRIRFDFFKTYPSTQGLEVMIISDNGQRSYNITASSPVADISSND